MRTDPPPLAPSPAEGANPAGPAPDPARPPPRVGCPVHDRLREEVARAQARRRHLGIVRPDESSQWALALSGGGIRSATFCLGVLQALARSPGPTQSAVPPPPGGSLLDQFDCVSTVSGGGYIGAFLSSLYVPGRLAGPGDSPLVEAQRVAAVLREDPPGRLGPETREFDPSRPGRSALAWLRDNGRYLAPSGAGDYLYALALALRNWLAMQYVVGTVIGLVVTCVVCLHWLMSSLPVLGPLIVRAETGLVWWSPLWWAIVPTLVLWTVPAGVAYWFTHMTRGVSARRCGFLIGGLMLGVGALLWHMGVQVKTMGLCLVMGTVSVIGVWLHDGARWWVCRGLGRPPSPADPALITRERVLLTRWFSLSLVLGLSLGGLALVDTVALTLLWRLQDWTHLLLSGSAVGVLVWVAQQVTEAAGDRQRPGWLSRVPLDPLLVAGGLLAWGLTAVAWELLVLAITLDWPGAQPWPQWRAAGGLPPPLYRGLVVFAVMGLLALSVGLFPGFLNLSTLQSLYSARLIRAYLGASNHHRFSGSGSVRRQSAAEPVEGDGLTLADIHDNPLAPMHLINVCLNETADPAEQLVQRDRKGRPLAVVPGGFVLDGQFYAFRRSTDDTEVADPLSLGEWIAVSGAAVTTGLGRASSLGASLLLGFANLRLGRWWPSGVVREASDGREVGLRRLLRTQFYLFDELTARFYGTRRRYQYLSDGGHFENTAVYELLRPGRQVRLVVVCDCGCDAQRRWDDLANLARLARIDHHLELEVDREIARHPLLGAWFGSPSQTGGTDPPRCALLVNVYPPERRSATPLARLLILKPTMIDALPLDVIHYHREHPTFPQESTGDQFFDEAQWESYRQLGLQMALRVFPQGDDPVYQQAFWDYMLA